MTVKIAITTVISLHSLIHLLGFFKAYGIGEFKGLHLPVSKPFGLLWALSFALFVITIVLFWSNNQFWWAIGTIAFILSQFLIFQFWQDAKYGSIANVIILLFLLFGYGEWQFESKYLQEVQDHTNRISSVSSQLINKEDLAHLPRVVQNYLQYVGVVGKPKVNNVKITFNGQMRNKGDSWFDFTSEQFNSFDLPSRHFFMKAIVKGIPTTGYHAYQDKNASMTIKLFSVIPIVKLGEKDKLFKTETVTYFNDLCLFAPAALIDKRIKWRELGEHAAEARYTNHETTISAVLHFDKSGALINFVSDDRVDINSEKAVRFSTPVKDYKVFNGLRLCTYGEATWHYPEGEFVYGKFTVDDIQYNLLD